MNISKQLLYLACFLLMIGNVQTHIKAQEVPPNDQRIRNVILSVDWNSTGTKIATGHNTGLVEVIDSSTGQTLQTFQFPGFIAEVAWSRHNSELLAAVANNFDMPGTIHILNTAIGQEVMTLTEGKQIPSIAWSPDGSHIAASIGFSADALPVRHIAIWDTTTGQISSTIGVGPREDLISLDWSPDGTRIVGSDRYTSIRVWDASTGIVDMTPPEHSGNASSVAWSPDGSRIASASLFIDNVIRVWDAATGQGLLVIPDSGATKLVWSPDGTHLAATNVTNQVRIWDASSGQLIDTITAADHLRTVAWSPDGTKLVFGGYSDSIEIVQFPIASPATEQMLTDSNGNGSELVTSTPPTMLPSPDETTSSVQGLLAYYELNPLTESLEIRMRNYDTGEDTEILSDRYDNFSPTLSIEAQKIAFISDRDGDMEIYTISLDGSHLTQITHNAVHDSLPIWSPDGTKIMFISRDPAVSRDNDIYTVHADGTNSINLTQGIGNNIQPSWSADGNRIIFVSYRNNESNIYYMDSDGQNLVQVTDAEDGIFIVPVFSPDGTKIAFAGTGGDYYVMNTDGTHVSRITQEADKGEFVWADHDTLLYESVQDGMTLINIDGSQRTPLEWFSPCECVRLTFDTLVINSPLITLPPE